MSLRSIYRAAAVCAALAVSVAAPAHAQLGGLRRAAARAAAGAVANSPANPASPVNQQAPASSRVNTGDVLEMTAPVLDRFQRALAAEAADRAGLAQRLAAVKTPQQYNQCAMQWYQSPAGQAEYQKLSAASQSTDQATILAAGNALKAALERACGVDPSERSNIESNAPAHAEAAGVAAGEFNGRQYAVIKERVIPFCRASAQAAGDADVRLPGSGSSVFWVYTAAEATALRGRCTGLMQAIDKNS